MIDYKLGENNMKNIALATIDCEIKGLQELKSLITDDFDKVLDLIVKIRGRVIISGVGKNSHIGHKIAASLASTGTPAIFIHPTECSHGDLGMITSDDLLIVLSNSGESKELLDVMHYARFLKIPLIGITSNKNSSMAKLVDYILLIPDTKIAPEACPFNKAPTTSTTTTLAIGDAITVALMHRKNFTLEQYKLRHPGGSLGKSILLVKDIMHKIPETPLCLENTPMINVVLTMTEKSLGCVGILDNDENLTGIITDGDLRRHICPDLMDKKAKDIMTKKPKVVNENSYIGHALQYMQDNSITNVFVLNNDKKLVGVLHIHQCI